MNKPAATYTSVMSDIWAGRARGNGARSVPKRQPKPAGAFQSEHVLQIAVAQYLDQALPPDAWWTSIDSAGRGARDGARMKRRGVRKGTLDTLVMWERLTIWIELKSKTGRLTKDQERFMAAAYAAGHHWYVARTIEGVEQALLNHGIPLRARLS